MAPKTKFTEDESNSSTALSLTGLAYIATRAITRFPLRPVRPQRRQPEQSLDDMETGGFAVMPAESKAGRSFTSPRKSCGAERCWSGTRVRGRYPVDSRNARHAICPARVSRTCPG